MSRRIAREIVLKSLFQIDFDDKMDEEIALNNVKNEKDFLEKDAEFAKELLKGTKFNLEKIDEEIDIYAKDWTVKRMSRVDRNIMRIAVYEMFLAQDPIPPSVSINEAVEIAKEYSTTEAAKFINGVLGNMARYKING